MQTTPPRHLPIQKTIALIALLSASLPSCKVTPNEGCSIQEETKKANNVVPMGPYHKKPGSWDVSKWIHKSGERKGSNTKFMVAEFDENGDPMIQAQLDGALAAIKEFKPQALILYAHGWHNDSSCRCEQKGGDMNDIDAMIDQMANPKSATPGDRRPQDRRASIRTMAIYVGWRGETKLGLARWFTLDDRRDAARSLGHKPKFKRFLGNVAAAGKESGANVVFVGHSLGAALMEKSASDMICEKKKDDDARLPHLFILVNSAEQSKMSEVEIEKINRSPLVQGDLMGTKLISPRVIAVTSLGDSADKLWNPLNTLIIKREPPVKTVGFDNLTRTHTLEKSDWQALTNSEEYDIYKASLKDHLDTAFWAPESHRKQYEIHKTDGITKYRMIPTGANARTPGFWNVQIPASLSSSHNDVYNQSIVSASINWLGVAKNRKKDLKDVLKDLEKELKACPVGSPDFEGHHPQRTQRVMGAATRMPYNKESIGLLLTELERPEPATKYRVNLFAILRFSHDAVEAWTPANLDRLRLLMDDKSYRDALKASGGDEPGFWHKRDRNLKSFFGFMRSHQIRTP